MTDKLPKAAEAADDVGSPSRTTSLLGPDDPAGAAVEVTRDDRGSARDISAEGRFLPGKVLAGRYRIVSILGRGAMGEVYRADDLKLSLQVALKFLPESFEADAERLRLLLEEVRLARSITHPNICRVYDVGEAEGHPFLSMEYIDGEDLATLLRRIGRLPQDKAAEIGLELCRGLEAAHQEGVLHRDLKPANLMIDGYGRARITDFGLAGLVGGTSRGGTPAYMAPEQLIGEPSTVKSDLYALGLVLYELFTGHRPYDASSPGELARRRSEGAPPSPSKLIRGFDPALERAILRCLELEPEARPASARSIATVLEQEAAFAWRPEPGRVIPQRRHWEVERRLGQGGFGEVWLAWHRKTAERRVFKFCYDAQKLQALQREITLFRLLKKELGDRDDIARILDWSFEEPPYFLEAEYTVGGNLAEWSEAAGGVEKIPLDDRLEIIAQLAEALAAAHSVGVLHKDVKPGNVLIYAGGDGRPRMRLADFGIGQATDEERLVEAGITVQGLTRTGADAGTPLYRAPELVEGKAATVQADIYAVGVMLYQVVVGDLFRALGPGWERDVDDELLREDIAAAVDLDPRRRLGNALRIAERLRALPERRGRRRSEERARQEAERARSALESSRRRLRWGSAALLVTLILAATLAFLALAIKREARRADREARRAEEQARRAQDIARVAVAGEWLPRDPTRAALVLLEVERPAETAYALSKMRDVLSRELAVRILRGHEDWVYTAAWSPTGEHLVTASQDGTARLYHLDGETPPTVLAGHEGTVWSASFSPDGRRVVTTSEDGTARIWPVRSSVAEHISAGHISAGHISASHILAGHDGNVWTASFSPDGERLVTASQDGTARIWQVGADGADDGTDDGAAAREPVVLAGHEENVWSVAWSPDGRFIATASRDGTARLWDAGRSATPAREAAVLAGHDGAVLQVAFSPDGKRLVTASEDGTARVWSVASPGVGRPQILRGHTGAVERAFWSPDGRRIATASRDGTGRIYTLERRREPPVVLGHHGGRVNDVVWSPDGERVATASHDGAVRVWAADGRGAPVVFDGHDGWIYDVGWSADGAWISSASQDGTVRIWNGETVEPAVLSGHEGAVVRAVWSPDGTRVLTASADATARIFRVGSPSPSGLSGSRRPRVLGARSAAFSGAALQDAAWSPDGGKVAVASAGGAAYVWELAEVTPPRTFAGHDGRVEALAWSPDGDRLATGDTAGTVRLWELDAPSAGSAAPRRLTGHGGRVEALAWSPNGRFLATASSDSTVRLWSVERKLADAGPTDRAERILEGHLFAVHALAWSPNGRFLATASGDGTARIWPIAAGVGEPVVLAGHVLEVYDVVWSPDGARVLTASQDGTARIWRADGSGEPVVLKGHGNVVLEAAWSPRGERVATASADGTAAVWPVEPGGDPILLTGHAGAVLDVAWSPEGERIVTASRDGTAHVWLLEAEDLLAAIRGATRACLDAELRVDSLGEAPEEARRRAARCERRSLRAPELFR